MREDEMVINKMNFNTNNLLNKIRYICDLGLFYHKNYQISLQFHHDIPGFHIISQSQIWFTWGKETKDWQF